MSSYYRAGVNILARLNEMEKVTFTSRSPLVHFSERSRYGLD